MQYLLGIDGGGTKTAFLLCDSDGNRLASVVGTGSSYKQHGLDAVIDNIKQHGLACCQAAGIEWQQLDAVCLGLPCFGESRTGDSQLIDRLARIFDDYTQVELVNDVVVGMAGSLAGLDGINIVAGTGSIAYGIDSNGNTARSGGWSEYFGDEGSCNWLGKQAMELFTKQSDGRKPRGELYRLFHERFMLEDDFDFIDIAEQQYIPFRAKTASLQVLLCDAAEAGDPTAVELYSRAAAELADIILATGAQLSYPEFPINVSYSGGLWKAGALVLEPLAALLRPHGYKLVLPKLGPVEGAVLMATRMLAPAQVSHIASALLSTK